MKTTVTAIFPGGIGEVEISRERADQILRLQKIIREQRELELQPYQVTQSWRTTTYDYKTRKWKTYPVFYVKQTENGPTKRVSLETGIKLIKNKRCGLTGDMKVWMMENGYGEVVKDLLHS